MKRFKNWSFLVVIMVVICMMFTFVACNNGNDNQENSGTNSGKSNDNDEAFVWTAQLAFAEAQNNGFTGTFEEFLKSLAGIKSVSIVDGNLIVTLGDGNTINAGKVTGEQGAQGIQGIKGDQGVQGEKGDNGAVGRVGFFVSNSAQLVAAANVPNSYIIVMNDITDGGAKISIQNDNQPLDFVLDLNGKNINSRLAIYGDKQTVNATVKNGTLGCNNNAEVVAGLFVGNSKVTLNVNNVRADGYWYGLATNGSHSGSTIIAKDCTFVGHCEIVEKNAGAYLPAGDTYVFENCTFEGYTGVATKSGTHTYTNCTIYGNGATYVEPVYNGDGVELDGCGLTVQYTPGYNQPLTLTVNGGEIKSDNAYAVSECTLSNTAEVIASYGTVKISEETILTAGEGYAKKAYFDKAQG